MISSLQTRYITASISLLVAVVVCFVWASWFVDRSNALSVSRMQGSVYDRSLSLAIRDLVWRADFSLNAYLLEPTDILKSEVLESLDNAFKQAKILSNSKLLSQLPLEHEISRLSGDVGHLREEAMALMAVRINHQKRFPAFIRLTESLYPANLEFLTATSLAIGPNESVVDDSVEQRLFSESRRIWSRMISSFRLFLAYRTGIMGSSEQEMEVHAQNIDVYYAGISKVIAQLQDLESKNQLSFQGEESLAAMRKIAMNWYSSFQDVLKIQTSKDWKLDEQIISGTLKPLSASINKTMNLIDDHLANSQKMELSALTLTANRVIESFWLIAFFVMTVVLLGYAYIKREVIDPIASVASAMKQKASSDQVAMLDSVSTREIQNLIQAFNALSTSLQQAGQDRDRAEKKARQAAKMSVIGEMAACIGHEINNPLNNMMRLSELMGSEIAELKCQGNLADDIHTLQSEQQRCADIVQELLNVGRPSLPAIKRTDLMLLISETAKLLTPLAAAKGIKLCLLEGAEFPLVHIDRGQIKQVLVNLVLNAIEASESGAEVVVRLKNDEAGLSCIVSDRGCGIDPDLLNKIFEPFFTTKQNEKGLGLGLAICNSIIQNHGGVMGASIRTGGGLSIWFSIPEHSERMLLEKGNESKY